MPPPPERPAPARGARLYFAWSPTIDPEERAAWLARNGHAQLRLPQGAVAEARGLDLVYSHASAHWGGRVAALSRKPGASVFGVLFEVPEEDWAALQEAEGVKSGKSVELEVELQAGGRTVKAAAFSPRAELGAQQGPVSQRYADALARGAEKAGLPAPYVIKLEAEAMLLQRVQGFGARMGLG